MNEEERKVLETLLKALFEDEIIEALQATGYGEVANGTQVVLKPISTGRRRA